MTTEEQKRKKRKRVIKILACLVGVFALVGCCSVGGLMFLGSTASVSVPGTVVVATRVATATIPGVVTTEANASNATAAAATPTPLPTLTPQPTTVPTPLPTAVPTPASTYSVEVVVLSEEVTRCALRWSDLFGRGADDPTLIFDSVWLGEVRSIAYQVKNLQEDSLSLPEPPPELRPSHDKFIQAMWHYGVASDLILTWTETYDIPTLNRAAEEIGFGNIAIEEATALIPD